MTIISWADQWIGLNASALICGRFRARCRETEAMPGRLGTRFKAAALPPLRKRSNENNYAYSAMDAQPLAPVLPRHRVLDELVLLEVLGLAA